ncbi:hypothetical protein [Nevskia sp.]|uniref:hypothetical protein n=1 Tax=Nevskia sp. TaxID=1929292 RepID=UPI0025F69DE2|nr:hypothetical protein [Nevskia sp.]
MMGFNKIWKQGAGLMLGLLAMTASAAPDVGTDNVGAVQGAKRVAIAEFGVEFYTQIYAQDRANSGGGSTAMVTATLDGVSDATLQAITDKAYADTVAALQAAGYEVVDPATLAANEIWQGQLAKYGLESPYTFSDSSFGEKNPQISKIFAPAGMKAFFSSSKGRGSLGQRVDSQNQGRGAKAGEIAKALDASLLHIHYLASFGLTSKPKRGWGLILGTKSRASIQSAPVLLPEETEWQINGPAGARTFTTSHRARFGGAIYLDDPEIAETDIFTMSESTTAAEKKGDNITNALGILFGSGTQKTKSFVSKPESEDAYKATFDKLIGETTAAFLQVLGSAR